MDQHNFVDLIRQVKDRVTVQDVLRHSGVSVPETAKAIICPLPGHAGDSKPSFSIKNDGHLYYCFGCHGAGDIFTLWQSMNGGTFFDALRALAESVGIAISLDEESRAAFQAARQRRNAYQDAADYLCERLASEEGAPALSYLESRGISKETCEAVGVGFNPGWDTLKRALNEKKHSDDELRAAGMLTESKSQRWLDFAPKCIVFLFKEAGEVRFMRGRVLPSEEDRGPKARSLNVRQHGSQATIPNLYYPGGKRPHRGAIVLLVEGEMDALSVHQAVADLGVERNYVVACIFGTGTHPTAIAKELEHAGRVVTMLDADRAGKDATFKLAVAMGERAYKAAIDLEDDPNARLQKVGREAFAQEILDAVQNSRPYIDGVIDELSGADMSPVDHAEAIKKQIVPLLAALPETHIDLYMEPISKKLGVQKRTMRTALGKHKDALTSTENEADAEQNASEVDRAMLALEERILPLYYERTGTCTTVCLYSRQRREVVKVPCKAKAEVVSALSPDLGPYDPGTFLCKRVSGLKPSAADGVLLRAMQSLSSRIVPKSSLKRLAEGVHFTTEGIVLVSGRDAYLSEEGRDWVQLVKPTIADKYLVDPQAPSESWLPFCAEELNRPLEYEPKEVVGHLHEMLDKFWVFKCKHDAWLHALLPFAFSMSGLWTRKPLLHVKAPSGSGKTKLVQGWYAGKKLEGTPGWVLPLYFQSDLSGAGVVARLDGSSLTLVMDEWESDEGAKGRVLDVLRYIRSATMGGAGSLRGTQSRGFVEQVLDVSAIAASIQDFERVADANRWMPSELQHLEPVSDECEAFPNPEVQVGRYLREHGLDAREMQRAILIGLLPQAKAMRQMVGEFMNDPRVSGLGVTTRFLENLVQPAVVAEACGFDGIEILQNWVEDHRDDYREMAEAREERELVRALMDTPFLLQQPSGGPVMTTLSAQLTARRSSPVELPGMGVWTVGNPFAGDESLRINWTTVAATILKGTRFASWSPHRLTKEARHSRAFMEGSTIALAGSGGKRVSVMSVAALIEDFAVDMRRADIKEESR